MAGIVMSIPPPGRGFQFKFPAYPNIFTVVPDVVIGAPKLRILFAGQFKAVAYTVSF